jgi:hypothetical protein
VVFLLEDALYNKSETFNLHIRKSIVISGVSKRMETKEGTQFRVIMEHEDIFFFYFWLFVNAQELL